MTFSTPFIESIYFLSANGVNFGVFGFCSSTSCSLKSIGYTYGSGAEIIDWLTQTQVLFGIGMCLIHPFLVVLVHIRVPR